MSKQTQEIELVGKDRTKAAFDSANARLKNLSFGVRRFGALLAGVGFVAATRHSLEFGDQVQKLSIRLGASTEFLSRMAFVAERSGVSFQTLTLGIQRMTRRIAEAGVGTGEARGALAELGINIQNITSLNADEQFLTVAEALSRVGNQSDRVRLAMKLFDSEGVALVQTMEEGAAGIIRLSGESDRLGKTLSTDAANAMATAKDATTNLSAAVSGLAQGLTARLAPGIAVIANGIAGTLLPAIDIARASLVGLMDTVFAVARAVKVAFVDGNIKGAIGRLKEDLTEAGASFKDSMRDAIDDASKRFKDLSGDAKRVNDEATKAAKSIRDTLGPGKDSGSESRTDALVKAAQGFIGAFDKPSAGPTTQDFDLSRLVSPVNRQQSKQITLLEQMKDLLEKIEQQRALNDVQQALAQ